MRRFPAPLFAILLLVPVLARAQQADSTTSDSITDSVFVRAQRLVSGGQGDSGRALVQAQLDAAPVGSPRYVEALYWRAVVAATAASAERDLRTIVIEYPLAPESTDALMRLAQLEMTRGDNDQALTHLERVVVEHPDSPARARAEFWMARVLLDEGNAPRACARLADASRSTPSSQVELHNQIDYLAQRCVGVDTTAAPQRGAPPAEHGSSSGASRHESAPSSAGTSSGERATTAAAPERSGSVRATQYTVQVAAYSTRRAAEQLRQQLLARGFAARVVGSQRPYRVRVGRYDTRAAANAAAAKLRAVKMTAIVTQAESR